MAAVTSVDRMTSLSPHYLCNKQVTPKNKTNAKRRLVRNSHPTTLESH